MSQSDHTTALNPDPSSTDFLRALLERWIAGAIRNALEQTTALTIDFDAALVEVLFAAPEPFLASDAPKAAELFNATGRRSRSLADCQIAAVALHCAARMATSNVPDFALFQSHGLILA